MLCRCSLVVLALVALASLGCEAKSAPKPPPVGVTPPPPPGSPAAASAVAANSGLPADLITKIDVLIQAHKDYTALAEKVQNVEDFKLHRDELSQIAQHSFEALDEIMIASAKLTEPQKPKFQAYMNEHVSPVFAVRRREYDRVQALLP